MKKTISLLAVLFVFTLSHSVMAQRGPAASPTASLKQMVGNTEMEIIYSRPSLDGRKMADLAPNGKVWRTGANNNTRINFNKDVMLGGKSVPAGEYSMYSIPGNSEWTIIINTVKSWGTQYDESKDVVRFTAKATKTSDSLETFRIDLADFDKNSKDSANLEIAWGNVSVKFPIKVTN